MLPLADGDGNDTVTGLDVCSSFLLVTTVFNVVYLYDLSRRSASCVLSLNSRHKVVWRPFTSGVQWWLKKGRAQWVVFPGRNKWNLSFFQCSDTVGWKSIWTGENLLQLFPKFLFWRTHPNLEQLQKGWLNEYWMFGSSSWMLTAPCVYFMCCTVYCRNSVLPSDHPFVCPGLLHFAWVIDDVKCIVVTPVCVCVCVCLSVCLSTAACPHYCMDTDVTWGSGRGCHLVVHYWADLQSVHRLRCDGSITRTRNKRVHACARSMPS